LEGDGCRTIAGGGAGADAGGGADAGLGHGALPPMSLAELERRAIAAALERNAYHREKSAAELGITRRTLLNKIKSYGLEPPASIRD